MSTGLISQAGKPPVSANSELLTNPWVFAVCRCLAYKAVDFISPQYYCSGLTTSTSHGVSKRTCLVTDSNNASSSSVSPRLPMTIRSEPRNSAFSRITSGGEPYSIMGEYDGRWCIAADSLLQIAANLAEHLVTVKLKGYRIQAPLVYFCVIDHVQRMNGNLR